MLTEQQINEIRAAWCQDTSADETHWRPENAAWGQCAVTALIVQDLVGGELRRLELPDGGGHYYNVVDGKDIDLTAEQFWFDLDYTQGCVRDRGYVLKFPATKARYELLKARAHKAYRA